MPWFSRLRFGRSIRSRIAPKVGSQPPAWNLSVATGSAIRRIPVDKKTELTFASGNLFCLDDNREIHWMYFK